MKKTLLPLLFIIPVFLMDHKAYQKDRDAIIPAAFAEKLSCPSDYCIDFSLKLL